MYLEFWQLLLLIVVVAAVASSRTRANTLLAVAIGSGIGYLVIRRVIPLVLGGIAWLWESHSEEVVAAFVMLVICLAAIFLTSGRLQKDK